jgi:hypothetical protein
VLPVGVEALGVVLVARLMLTLGRPAPAVLRLLASRRARSPRQVDDQVALAAVRRAGRVWGATCLAQSVGLASMLHRRGDDAAVVLGCRRQPDGEWTAHAWVEVAGRRLEPVVSVAHSELARLEAARGWRPTAAGPRLDEDAGRA